MALLFVPDLAEARYASTRGPSPVRRKPTRSSTRRRRYLNPSFFLLRAAIFFAIWAVLIFFLNKWSREQDEQPAELPGPKDRRSRMLSGPGLVLYVATVTFMSIDWVMSLDPHWYSTIFGVLTLGGQGLSDDGVHDPRAGDPRPVQADVAGGDRRHVPRSRQADVRVRHAVGVLLGVAAPHHLVGEPARGDSVLPRSASTARGIRSAWRCSSASSRCRSCSCCRRASSATRTW